MSFSVKNLLKLTPFAGGPWNLPHKFQLYLILWYNGDLNSGNIWITDQYSDVRYSNGGLNTGPSGNQTTFNNLNTQLDSFKISTVFISRLAILFLVWGMPWQLFLLKFFSQLKALKASYNPKISSCSPPLSWTNTFCTMGSHFPRSKTMMQ